MAVANAHDGLPPALLTDCSFRRGRTSTFASCDTCAAVSVAFQVVFVSGDNDVAAPQNIAAAVNYNCANCLTYALAKQLFVTLDGPLSDEAMAQLDGIWAELAAFGKKIATIPLSEVEGKLAEFQQAILDVIEKDQPGTVPTGPSESPSEGTSSSPTAEPSESTTGSPSSSPTGSPSGSPSAEPSGTPSPTQTPTGSPTSTPSPTGTASTG